MTLPGFPIPLFIFTCWPNRTFIHVALLILISAAVPTFFHFLLEINGMLIFNRWAWWDNFLYAAAVYNTLALFLFHRLKLAAEA